MLYKLPNMEQLLKKVHCKYFYTSTGPGGAMVPPTFCVAEGKKGDKGKKERISKRKLLKSCHQGQNIALLAILEGLEFENFFVRQP